MARVQLVSASKLLASLVHHIIRPFHEGEVKLAFGSWWALDIVPCTYVFSKLICIDLLSQ